MFIMVNMVIKVPTPLYNNSYYPFRVCLGVLSRASMEVVHYMFDLFHGFGQLFYNAGVSIDTSELPG